MLNSDNNKFKVKLFAFLQLRFCAWKGWCLLTWPYWIKIIHNYSFTFQSVINGKATDDKERTLLEQDLETDNTLLSVYPHDTHQPRWPTTKLLKMLPFWWMWVFFFCTNFKFKIYAFFYQQPHFTHSYCDRGCYIRKTPRAGVTPGGVKSLCENGNFFS